MISSKSVLIAILFLIGIANCLSEDEDLLAAETSDIGSKEYAILENEASREIKKQPNYRSQITSVKHSIRVEENHHPSETFSVRKANSTSDQRLDRSKHASSSSTEAVLDFRISGESEEVKENEVHVENKRGRQERRKLDMRTATTVNGKQKKETFKSDEEEEEKNLAQQVADGKYGLIQNEIFPNGSKRPGILSYRPNEEVPKDTKDNFGGLEKDEIWLAEDHVLVLRGGRFPEVQDDEAANSPIWPPIDDYVAPTRQVKIPENPKIPPPFPIQLVENGPLELIKGENDTPPNFPVPPYVPFPFQPNGTLPFPPPPPFFFSPENINKTLPFNFPPPGPFPPPFPGNFPPGAAFLPPPGNGTEFDEDDPSIYYPPRYDFYYQQDNSTAVPPGPLVPGIVLPPPPNFFAPLQNDSDDKQKHKSDHDSYQSTKPPFIASEYLPANKKPPSKSRTVVKRPLKRPVYTPSANAHEISNQIIDTTPAPEYRRPTITYVYPENTRPTPASHFNYSPKKVTDFKTPDEGNINGYRSPIYVPNKMEKPMYHPIPTTSPKPNHITIPTAKTLSKEIYIVAKPKLKDQNQVEDIEKEVKAIRTNKYENLSPELHPLRSLIRPNVSVSYVGKYGHLPPSTPFPFPKLNPPIQQEVKPIRGGHFVTQLPEIKENLISTASPDYVGVTVTPIPVVKKIRVRPILPDQSQEVTSSMKPSKATFYFYEETPATENPGETTSASPLILKEKPKILTENSNLEVRLPQPQPQPQPQPPSPPPSPQYYSIASNPKTPVRQFLEETFHSSNVLQGKPQIGQLSNADIAHPAVSSPEVYKMKHLNYGPHVTSRPAIKYHYVTEDHSILVPGHKIKTLEIENSGSTGLQNIQQEKLVLTTMRPFSAQEIFTTNKPDKQKQLTLSQPTTVATPINYENTDGPFIPSNYYATAEPEHIHLTPPNHSIVDDITQNYFTIFGQKINSVSTTPLTPVKKPFTTSHVKTQPALSYIPDTGNNFHIQQVEPPKKIKPNNYEYFSNDKNKFLRIVTPAPRPKSNFEQYLKEITGVDQKDYIISNVLASKVKKGKGITTPRPIYNNVQPHLQAPNSVYLSPYRQPGLLQYYEDQIPSSPLKTYYQQSANFEYDNFGKRPKLQYRPSYATTLRPVMDVEIHPQYVQHLSSTSRPIVSNNYDVMGNKIRVNHNFESYLQEFTRYTSPTTVKPVQIKIPSNSVYYPSSTPMNQIGYLQPQYPQPEAKPKPPSLEGDLLVNYKPQRPGINPESEIINVQSPLESFDTSTNFKIVDPPDLSGQRNRVPLRSNHKPKAQGFDATKEFFENLPHSGYFTPSHQSTGNSFISYNLPGNGGHFYFLTPQIVEKNDESEYELPREEYSAAKRNSVRQNRQRIDPNSSYSSHLQQNSENSYANQEYLRRRRKKA